MQVEYAMKAIDHAGASAGVVFSEGVVLAGEKKTISKLLESGRSKEKLFRVDDHIVCAIAGVTSDASTLLETLRIQAQNYRLSYDEPIPVEQTVTHICNFKQSYTQFGGLRPFGVSFLFAGWDAHFGFQLYHSDPSGNYAAWKATAIGLNNETAKTTLREGWSEGLDQQQALDLLVKVMSRTMDAGKPTAENLEICVLTVKGAIFLDEEAINELIKRIPPTV